MSNNWKEIYQNIQLGLSLDCDIIGDSYYLYSSIFSAFQHTLDNFLTTHAGLNFKKHSE